MTSRILIAALLLAGCEIEDSQPTTTMTTSTPTASLGSALIDAEHRMHVRFEAARQIEQAIAWNDLDKAHSEATALAQLDEPAFLPVWQPYLDDIAANAMEIKHATDTMSAARAAGALGAHCASCHVATSAHVPFANEQAPRTNPRVGPTMADHQWAATQLWEGLIGPSDERWLAGANALTTVPLNLVAQAVTPSSPTDVDDVSRVRLYARRALATPPQDRGVLFGNLLATCAHCHALLRDR